MPNRRQLLTTTAALAALGVAAAALWSVSGGASAGDGAAGEFEYSLSDAEWRAKLTEMEYGVLRKEATEAAFSSPLNDETRAGTYRCKGCDLALYASAAKFKSGTGWPSFYEALPDAVGTKEDNAFFMTRTEVHCRRCGGHLGHIFDDGPPPTGKRHCINGVALSFEPASA